MNVFRMAFLFAVLFFLTACSEEDGATDCEQSDWVGTYSGTIDCDGETEAVTLVITALGDSDIIVSYSTALVSDYSPGQTTPDGCEIEHTLSEGGLEIVIMATLSESELIYEEEITTTDISFGGSVGSGVGGEQSSTCIINATKD